MTLPELAELRVAIDAVDRKILALVAERAHLVLEVGEIKRQRSMPVYDPRREREMLDTLSHLAEPPLDAGTVRRVFERLIDECRRIEQIHTGELRPPDKK